MNRVMKKIRMYSFEYTPLYNFTGIQFLPNESLKTELKLSFKLLINYSFMKNQWKFTVQKCSRDGQVQLLKTNCILELNSKFKTKN